MTYSQTISTSDNQLNATNRVNRVAVASILLGAVVTGFVSNPGLIFTLSMASIYLVFTAIISLDPVSTVVEGFVKSEGTGNHNELSNGNRAIRTAAATAMLASVVLGVVSTPAMIFSLSMIACYLVFTSIVSLDPLHTALSYEEDARKHIVDTDLLHTVRVHDVQAHVSRETAQSSQHKHAA
ncbi:MAG: hypothetical protein ACE5EH_11505 [Gammaproteobacteria bacterium]